MELPWCKEKLFGACETLFQVQGTHQGPCLHGVSQAISKCNHFWKLQMPGRQTVVGKTAACAYGGWVGGRHCLEVSEGRSEKVTLGGRDLPLGGGLREGCSGQREQPVHSPEARKPHSIQEQKEGQCTWNRESEKPLGEGGREEGQRAETSLSGGSVGAPGLISLFWPH